MRAIGGAVRGEEGLDLHRRDQGHTFSVSWWSKENNEAINEHEGGPSVGFLHFLHCTFSKTLSNSLNF